MEMPSMPGYDPFAQPTPPLAPNNALATVAQPNGQFPINPGANRRPMMGFDPRAFMQSMQAWRQQRPDRSFTYDPTLDTSRGDQARAYNQGFMSDLQDWRSQRPAFGGFSAPVTTGNPSAPIPVDPVMTPGGGTGVPGTPGGPPLQGQRFDWRTHLPPNLPNLGF